MITIADSRLLFTTHVFCYRDDMQNISDKRTWETDINERRVSQSSLLPSKQTPTNEHSSVQPHKMHMLYLCHYVDSPVGFLSAQASTLDLK